MTTRHDDDAEQLDDPAVRPFGVGSSWRRLARRRGRHVGRLVVGVHGPRSITRSGAVRPVSRGITTGVTPPGQDGTVVSAVIFDFYGTLAHWADADGHNYASGLRRPRLRGSTRPSSQEYFSRYDGVDHAEHSVSEEAYEAWVRARLGELTDGLRGGGAATAELVIDALRDSDQGPMVAYPEAAATLSALREAGLAVGVCSNWGWELDAFLARGRPACIWSTGRHLGAGRGAQTASRHLRPGRRVARRRPAADPLRR